MIWLLALLVALAGCGGGGGSAPKPQAPLAPIGYSLISHWDTIDQPAFAHALRAAGLGLTEIEYTLPPDGHTDLAAAVAFVDAMRADGIVTFINVANWNSPQTRAQDDAWFQARVDEIVSEIGPDHVMLGAVSEPDGSAKPTRWAQYARAHWTGEFVLPGNFVHPDLPADLLDVHYCDRAKLERELAAPTAGRLFNTDCTPILNPGPIEGARLAAEAHAADNTFLVYDNRALTPDVATIASMGDGLHG